MIITYKLFLPEPATLGIGFNLCSSFIHLGIRVCQLEIVLGIRVIQQKLRNNVVVAIGGESRVPHAKEGLDFSTLILR